MASGIETLYTDAYLDNWDYTNKIFHNTHSQLFRIW